MQSDNKHHVKQVFQSSMLICFRDKTEDSARFATQYEETGTVEVRVWQLP